MSPPLRRLADGDGDRPRVTPRLESHVGPAHAVRVLTAAFAVGTTASALSGATVQDDPVRIVATLPAYGDLARTIGGDQVEVMVIAHGKEDPHLVRPKPSFARDLRRADLFITTGLDLELWVPALLDRAGNADVREGGLGYVTAYTGIDLLDVPVSPDRSGGDVHLFGNPHLHTDPLRMVQVARNITTGLTRVAPERAAVWDDGLLRFTDRIRRAMYGDGLLNLISGETLDQLALSGTLISFLEDNAYEGKPLIDRLGGWMAQAEPFRGGKMVCYQKNWAYFEDRFLVACARYVEPRTNIPATPRQVAELTDLMRQRGLGVVLAASYIDERKVELVAERGGGRSVIVPFYPLERGQPADYFELLDSWISQLARAFSAGPP